MDSKINGVKRKWNGNFDLVPSFSDSDDVPDLDGEAEVEVNVSGPNKKRRAQTKDRPQVNGLNERPKAKKKRPQQEETDDDETSSEEKGEDDGAFDPDFQFDGLGADGAVEEGFGEWDVPGISKKARVGVDDIIQRRTERKKVEEENAKMVEDGTVISPGEIEDTAFDDEEDELLAEDAFGMGVENMDADTDEENEGDDTESASQGSEHDQTKNDVMDGEDDDSIAEPVPHPDDLAVSDNEYEDPEDPAEAAKRDAFFSKDEPTNEALSRTQFSFQSMHLSRPILKGLTMVGFSKPTPIQSKTIPIALLGKDVVGGAVTGSGKTAAFILPILERLLYRPNEVPTTRVSILLPTRELAVQCHNVATKLAQFTDITFALIVGGLSLREQEATLRKRPDVVVATPGRFIDHMRNSPSFAVDSVEILVLDEADRMLEDGFADELNELLRTMPRSRQTMLFSATMTTGVDDLIRAGLNKPARILVDAEKTTVPKLIQEFIKIKTPKSGSRPHEEDDHRRLAYLVSLCSHVYTGRTIIFLPTKHFAHRVKVLFALRNIPAAELHGSMSQEQRLNAIASFRDGRATHLLATDVASRGLDLPRVETVINYTVPTTSVTYLHRVGRTARAGRNGVSVTLFEGTKKSKAAQSKGPKGSGKQTASERALLKPILKLAKAQKAPIRTRSLPGESSDALTATIAGMQDEIDDVLKEEKEERMLQQSERDVEKGENLVRYETEIKSRPKRTWFQGEKEKQEAKTRGADERQGVVDGVEEVRKVKRDKRKLSGKEKKRLQDRDDRLQGKGVVKKSKASMRASGKGAKGKPKGKPKGKKRGG